MDDFFSKNAAKPEHANVFLSYKPRAPSPTTMAAAVTLAKMQFVMIGYVVWLLSQSLLFCLLMFLLFLLSVDYFCVGHYCFVKAVFLPTVTPLPFTHSIRHLLNCHWQFSPLSINTAVVRDNLRLFCYIHFVLPACLIIKLISEPLPEQQCTAMAQSRASIWGGGLRPIICTFYGNSLVNYSVSLYTQWAATIMRVKGNDMNTSCRIAFSACVILSHCYGTCI